MEILSGVLTVKISNLLKNKILSNQWCVLYSGHNAFPPVIEVSEQNGDSEKKKRIELEKCHWIKAGTIEPTFCINIKSKSYTFVAQSEQERRDWVLYLGCLTSELSESKTQSRMPKGSGSNYDGMVMEDNVLYSTTDQISKFDVVADHNKGDCAFHNFKGIYSLAFDAHSISLLRHGTEIKVAVWTYYTIRSYGFSTHTVTFNVGTSSSTGEGVFSFLTTDGKEMIEMIKQKTANIREKKVNNTKSQANNTQAASPTTASKPPVFPKTTQVSTSSRASTKSTNSASGIAVQNSIKRKPAPLASFSSNAQASADAPSIDPNFIKALNQNLAHPSSPTPTTENNHKSLSSAPSLESLSSASSKKERKKQREKEKELKKQEEKAAKEKAKKEKEMEKALKKATKKNKSKKEESSSSAVSVPPEFNDQANIYDQTDEDYSSISHTESSKQVQGAYEYSDVNIPSSEIETAEAQYAAPWKDFLSSPSAYDPVNEENIYATPQKSDKIQQRKQKASQGDEYEDLDVQNEPPPDIPKRADVNDEALNNNIYDHFHQPAKTVENPENVYGIESASAPFSSMKKRSPNVSSHRQVREDKPETDVYESF